MKNSLTNFTLVEHPLIKRDITQLRDENSNQEVFRSAVDRISRILAVEVSRELSLISFEVKSPLEKTTGYKLEKELILVPILRAGLGMVKGFLDLIPELKVGHIGIQRNEKTLEPLAYYFKTPANMSNAVVILVDPMLATGGSASAALKFLKEKGAKNLVLVCLVAAPEGINKVKIEHPEIKIFGAALDRELNEKGYILPGLGDAGDRTFGTL